MVVESVQEDNLLDFADLCTPYVHGEGSIASLAFATLST